MTKPILAVENLNLYYGESHVVRDVSFRLGERETIAVMGRNGMGKTTLLRSLMGLTPPKRGRVVIDGRDMTRAPVHAVARAGLALVPEGRGMFPSLTVREHLVMAARPGHDGRAEWTLARVLETFPRLAERLDLGGTRLSGGEQQMLTIGRALMTNPDLLILDEATEGLAPLIAREIWAILRRIRASGIAAVIVDKTHAAVTAIADRCVILVKGRTVFADAAAALRAEPGLFQKHLGV